MLDSTGVFRFVGWVSAPKGREVLVSMCGMGNILVWQDVSGTLAKVPSDAKGPKAALLCVPAELSSLMNR